MKAKTTRDIIATAILGALALFNPLAQADEIGHFVPGVPNVRDFTVPNDPGFYGIGYNYFYNTTRLNDRNGDKVDSITINPRGGTGKEVGVDIDVNLYALSPSILDGDFHHEIHIISSIYHGFFNNHGECNVFYLKLFQTTVSYRPGDIPKV